MPWIQAKIFLNGNFKEIKCPRCGTFTSSINPLKTCSKCGAIWRKRRQKYEFLI